MNAQINSLDVKEAVVNPPAYGQQLRQVARAGIRFGRFLLAGSPAPVSITYHVTYRCNLSCMYCPLPQRTPELTPAESLELVEALGRRGVLRLGLSGGEPLLRDDLGELVRAARRHGTTVSVGTNAILLPERLELVREADLLLVSLDGPREVHDGHRGIRAFDRTIAGIEAAHAAGIPMIFLAVVTRHSADSIEELLRLADNYGTQVYFQPVLIGQGATEEDALRDDELKALFGRLEALKLGGRPVGNSLDHLRGAQRNPLFPIAGPCPARWLVAAVQPDGSLAPCCEWHRFELRSQGTVPLDTLSERFTALRRPPCESCATVGNVEARRLAKLSPSALLQALQVVLPMPR